MKRLIYTITAAILFFTFLWYNYVDTVDFCFSPYSSDYLIEIIATVLFFIGY